MMSKVKLNEENLKDLFGKENITKNQKELYNNLVTEDHRTLPSDITKYLPDKDKLIKKAADIKFRKSKKKKSKSNRKGCGCK